MSRTPDGLPVAPADAAWGELIVLTGELSGTRWLLQSPAVVLGQKDGCDYRLDDPDVSPIHAILVRTAEGTLLRDLGSDGGSFVNGETVAEAELRDGDLIALGSMQFEFHRREILDEATLLEHRRRKLARQKAQLDAQFQARQRQLVRLRNEAHAATQALRAERNSYKKYVARTTVSFDVARSEIAAAQEEARAERRRLVRVHQQLKTRTERRCLTERRALDERAGQLDARQAELAQVAQNLEREKQGLLRDRARFNGEMEIAKRQLQAGWNEFKDAQRHWDEGRTRQERELQEATHRLDSRIAAHDAKEDELADQRRHWGDRLRALQAETEGLENRIGNQRRKLHDQEEELNRLTAAIGHVQRSTPQPSPMPFPADRVEQLTAREQVLQRLENDAQASLDVLEAMAGELMQQREELAVQAAHLQSTRVGLEDERRALAAALEPIADRLHEREHQLRVRQEHLETLRREHQERRQALDKWQTRLQARQAQLDVRRTEWESERQRCFAQMRGPEANGHPLREQAHREMYERQIRTLTEEVERLACLLIDDEPSILALPSTRAA